VAAVWVSEFLFFVVAMPCLELEVDQFFVLVLVAMLKKYKLRQRHHRGSWRGWSLLGC
jgi:hypothetical protein